MNDNQVVLLTVYKSTKSNQTFIGSDIKLNGCAFQAKLVELVKYLDINLYVIFWFYFLLYFVRLFI